MSPKMKIIGFGSHGHGQKSRNHENQGFSGSHIMNPRSYYSKMKQNNSTELLVYSFHNIYNENDPPPPHRWRGLVQGWESVC